MAALPVALVAGIIAVLIMRGLLASHEASKVDPRLILHPHNVPIEGNLGHVALGGWLYPAIPGRNTITIAGLTPERGASLTLVITMPGMRMAPIVAQLRPAGTAFSAPVALPMFGNYAAQVTLVSRSRRITGSAQLHMPLTLGN